jgi:hypothetical protein
MKKMIVDIWEFIAPLASDWSDQAGEFRISIGRISFWIALGVSIGCYWAKGVDVPANLWGLLVALLIYVTGTKVTQTFKDIKLGNGEQTQNGGEGDAPKP